MKNLKMEPISFDLWPISRSLDVNPPYLTARRLRAFCSDFPQNAKIVINGRTPVDVDTRTRVEYDPNDTPVYTAIIEFKYE